MQHDPFLSFRTLITGELIKAVYVVGLIILTIAGGLLILFPFIEYYFAPPSKHLIPAVVAMYVSGGLALLTIGNLFWRLFCEGWILLFSIHEILASIESKMGMVSERVYSLSASADES